MGVLTILLIIFTAAMTTLTATLYGILVLTKLSLANYEVAGRWSFVVSLIAVVTTIVLSGESYATVCTWMSGLSLLGIGAMLITLLIRNVEWK